jgi:hypothetical protein
MNLQDTFGYNFGIQKLEDVETELNNPLAELLDVDAKIRQLEQELITDELRGALKSLGVTLLS